MIYKRVKYDRCLDSHEYEDYSNEIGALESTQDNDWIEINGMLTKVLRSYRG